MKILAVTKNMRVANGVASYLMNYYCQLKNQNIKIDFLIVNDVGSPYYEEIKKNGDNVYLLPSYKKNFIKCVKFLKNLFKDKQYDIIDCNVINSGALILRLAYNKVPIRILHCHATVNGDNLLKRIINIPFQYIAKKYSNYYIACSKMAGESLFKKQKFTLIYNAIDLEKYKFNKKIRSHIRKKENINNNTLVIMTVGRFTKQKNPFFIVDVIDDLSRKTDDFVFLWIGDGKMQEQVKKYAKQKKVFSKIKFLGAKENVNDYYSAADIFILPSLYEGLPVVGIEAQISGLICLFSDKITQETKIFNYCHFISIKKSNEWSQKILKLIKIDNKERDKRFMHINDYDINYSSLKLIDFYDTLIKKEKGEKDENSIYC